MEDNVRSFGKFIELDSVTEEMIQVKLKTPMVKVFGEAPHFKIIQNRATKKVRQVIFFSYHSQSLFARNVEMPTRAYHDLLWNAVAEMAMIEAPKRGEMYFMRQVAMRRRAPKADKYKDSQFHLSVRLVSKEKRSGVLLPEGAVRHAFRKTLSKRPELFLLPDSNGSYVRTILMFFVSRAQQTMNDPAWRRTSAYHRMYASHIRNLDAHRAAGLARGRETRQTQAYKASDNGMYSAASLQRSATLPRNKQAERIAALLKCKQVRDLRDQDPDDLDVRQRAIQSRVRSLSTMDKKKLGQFFRQHVVWWAPWQPQGLRYDGDGSDVPDDFNYDIQDRPAVMVSRPFKPHEKKAFVVEEQPAEDAEDE